MISVHMDYEAATHQVMASKAAVNYRTTNGCPLRHAWPEVVTPGTSTLVDLSLASTRIMAPQVVPLLESPTETRSIFFLEMPRIQACALLHLHSRWSLCQNWIFLLSVIAREEQWHCWWALKCYEWTTKPRPNTSTRHQLLCADTQV